MAEHVFIELTAREKAAVGQCFGKLVIVGAVGRGHRNALRWVAKCECGGDCTDYLWNLRRNTSCGCHKASRMGRLNLTHGHTRSGRSTSTFKSWAAMVARCVQPNDEHWPRYGGRGIKVCDRWRESFETFLSDMGERPRGKTIDRIDGDGNYEPGNCRWATPFEQRVNMKTNIVALIAGERQTVGQAARRLGMSTDAIRYRLQAGWTNEAAFTTPRQRPSTRIKRAT